MINRIFLIGYMGSGKTSMGKLLAENLQFTYIDMDAHIEKKYHRTVTDIFTQMGESKFREIERDCLHETADFENVVISTGGGTPCFFDNMEYMNTKGITVYLKLTPEQLVVRLENSRKGKRPLLADRKGNDLLKFIEQGLNAREPFYNRAQRMISGTDEEMVREIISFKI